MQCYKRLPKLNNGLAKILSILYSRDAIHTQFFKGIFHLKHYKWLAKQYYKCFFTLFLIRRVVL